MSKITRANKMRREVENELRRVKENLKTIGKDDTKTYNWFLAQLSILEQVLKDFDDIEDDITIEG